MGGQSNAVTDGTLSSLWQRHNGLCSWSSCVVRYRGFGLSVLFACQTGCMALRPLRDLLSFLVRRPHDPVVFFPFSGESLSLTAFIALPPRVRDAYIARNSPPSQLLSQSQASASSSSSSDSVGPLDSYASASRDPSPAPSSPASRPRKQRRRPKSSSPTSPAASPSVPPVRPSSPTVLTIPDSGSD